MTTGRCWVELTARMLRATTNRLHRTTTLAATTALAIGMLAGGTDAQQRSSRTPERGAVGADIRASLDEDERLTVLLDRLIDGAQGGVAGGGSDCCIANGTPGCDDPTCEGIVCGIDPFCCDVAWDGICAAEAADLCAACAGGPEPPCALDCPPGGIDEEEPCGADTNGGCNTMPPPPEFFDAECSGTYCGTSWADGGTRDTDWYRVEHGGGTLSATLVSKFEGVCFIIDGIDACAPVVVGVFGCGNACANITVASADLPPGTYVVFVAPGNCAGGGIFDGLPCGSDRNDYFVEIDFNETICSGACCLEDGTCVDGISLIDCSAQGGLYQGADTTCAKTDCVGRCCYGDPLAPDCDDTSEVACNALGGLWDADLDCTTECLPQGRCCYGDPLAPSCAVNTLPECDALPYGSWTLGGDCSDPCPIAAPKLVLSLGADGGAAGEVSGFSGPKCGSTILPGGAFTVVLSMADLGILEAAGFQAFLDYDADAMMFQSGEYTNSPFGFHILDPIEAVVDDMTGVGYIDLAASVNQAGGQEPTSSDAPLAYLHFVALDNFCAPPIGFNELHEPVPSRITDDQGNPLPGLLLIEPDPDDFGPILTMDLKTDVPVAAGETIEVNLRMCNLCDDVAGYQAFLKFDSAQLNFVGGTYELDPFGFVVEPFDATNVDAANETGCITVAASINQSAGQEPTSLDGLLATLVFSAKEDVCVPQVVFDDGTAPPLSPPVEAPLCDVSTSDCCIDNGTPGCDDPACQDTVCTIDPFCCDVVWDGLCASQAQSLCTGNVGGHQPPTRLTDDAGNPIDILLLQDLVDIGPPTPKLTLAHGTPDDAGVMEVTLSQSGLCETPAAGWQAFLKFSPLELNLLGGTYTSEPYGFIVEPIDGAAIAAANDSGAIDVAASINPNTQDPTIEAALLVTLVFQLKQDCIGDVEFRNNVPPTRLTDDMGNPIAPELCVIGPPTITVVDCSNDSVVVDDACAALVPDYSDRIVFACDAPNPTVLQDPEAGTVVTAPDSIMVTLTADDGIGGKSTCSFTLDVVDDQDPTITAPADIIAYADPGECFATITDIGEAIADDNCDVDVTNNAPANDIYPPGDSVVTWTAEDSSGNTAVDTQVVTVLEQNEIAVDVELMGVNPGRFFRCITFEVVDCDTGTTEIVEAVVEFIDGLGTASIGVPCELGGNPVIWDCITARDRLHTLRRTQDLVISGNQYLADFTGSESLIGGNLNDDQFIDILDFGIYTSQFGMNVGVDTDCDTAGPHADISGSLPDGAVDTGDFTFIQINFLTLKEPDCDCASPLLAGDPQGPLAEISVAELVARDMAELAVADLNGDGVLDVLDMVAFINGDRPQVDARLVIDGGSWFDDGNWVTGEQPGEDTDVVLDRHVLITQPGAVAATVTVDAGGHLHLANGTLQTALLTVHAGGVLQLDGVSVLSVNALSLEAGALLAWNGGLIEIAGGTLSLADLDLLVGTTGALSSLSLIQGASAAITQDAVIGLGTGHLGLVEVDGGSALLVGRTTYVGLGGEGTLLVTNGGLATSLDAHLGLLPGSAGEAVVSGVGSTWALTDGITVGGQGLGMLTVADGGTVSATTVTVGANGTLAMELGSHGGLHASGTVTLGGTLTVLLPEGATLQVGDRFRLVTAGAVVGSFDQLHVPDVDGMRLNVTYEPDSVNVRVVPAALSDQTPTGLGRTGR